MTETEKIIEMYDKYKLTMQQIATLLNISMWKVHDRLHKNGVEIRPSITPATIEKARKTNTGRKMSDEERKARSIANKVGGVGSKKLCKSNGYYYLYFPDHPAANGGWILEHRLVMEVVIGRRLEEGEVVHHINGIKTDNRKENLALMTDSEHRKYHMKERNKLYEQRDSDRKNN